jgi:dTDP-4-dehydrorhamnose reductase
MRILIIGASSYVGARIYSYLKGKYQTTGTYFSNRLFPELEYLDITSNDDVIKFVKKNKPNFIIHVAANASASWCENNSEKAVSINEEGTRYIVDAANSINSKVIFISSFEHSNDKTLYGRTKEHSEDYVKQTKAGYVILRPSLIIGLSPNTTNDRPFNRLLKNITQHTPGVYDASWRFHPTWLRHIVEIIDLVIAKGIINEIIPISVPEIKTRYDIARDLLSDFGINPTPDYPKSVAPLISEDLSDLIRLKLPKYSYTQMINGIKQELKAFNKQ